MLLHQHVRIASQNEVGTSEDTGTSWLSSTDQSWDKFNINKNSNSNTPKHKCLNPWVHNDLNPKQIQLPLGHQWLKPEK